MPCSKCALSLKSRMLVLRAARPLWCAGRWWRQGGRSAGRGWWRQAGPRWRRHAGMFTGVVATSMQHHCTAVASLCLAVAGHHLRFVAAGKPTWLAGSQNTLPQNAHSPAPLPGSIATVSPCHRQAAAGGQSLGPAGGDDLVSNMGQELLGSKGARSAEKKLRKNAPRAWIGAAGVQPGGTRQPP